jgi:hypothetical protein
LACIASVMVDHINDSSTAETAPLATGSAD